MPSPQVRPPCVIPPAAPCRDWCQGHGGMPRLGQAITWLHVTLSACPTAGRGGPFPGSSPVLLLIPSALGSSAALHAKPRSLLSRIGSGGRCHQVAAQGGRPLPPDHLGQQEERRCCIERSASASHLHPAGRQAQPRRHRGAKLPAGIDVLTARGAKHGHWSLRAPPRPCAIAPTALTALTALVSLLPSTCNAQGRRTVASRHG